MRLRTAPLRFRLALVAALLAGLACAVALAAPQASAAPRVAWEKCPQSGSGIAYEFIRQADKEWCEDEAERRYKETCRAGPFAPGTWCHYYGSLRSGAPVVPLYKWNLCPHSSLSTRNDLGHDYMEWCRNEAEKRYKQGCVQQSTGSTWCDWYFRTWKPDLPAPTAPGAKPPAGKEVDWGQCPQADTSVDPPVLPGSSTKWCVDEAERRFTASCSKRPTGDLAKWCDWYREAKANTAAADDGADILPADDGDDGAGYPEVADGLFQSPQCAGVNVGNCARSGVLSRPYKLSHYGVDSFVDTGLTKTGNYLYSWIHGLVGLLWQGLLWVINGVLIMLEWAFNLKLTERAMPEIKGALLDLHENVLGTPWTLAAIAVAGLWGIYNGLVRLRTIQTIGALGATVLLMAVGLYVINKPDETVGEFSRLTSDAALSVMGVGTGKSGDDALGDASENLFTLIVLHPWCALEFGSVSACYQRDPEAKMLVKDAFLRHPTGSTEREDLYERYKDDGTFKRHTGLMGKEGAFVRVGLLVMIGIGLLGAIFLLFWLGLKLIVAGVMALGLTLIAPVMFLAPALGEKGRSAVGTWALRLAGAVGAALVFALFLALVVFLANIIASLESIGFGARWLILTVFWWGVFTHRQQLVGFAMGGAQSPLGGGMGLLKAYLGYRAVRDIGGSLVNAATYVPRKTARGAWAATRGTARAYRQGTLNRDTLLHPIDSAADGVKRVVRPGHAQAQETVARQGMRRDLERRTRATAEAERDQARQTLDREAQWQRWSSSGGAGRRPRGSRPTGTEVQAARQTIGRYGSQGRIAVTDADIERYVQRSGNPVLQRRLEVMQRGGLTRQEIRLEANHNSRFNDEVRVERRRFQREERLERRRRKVYR